MEKYSHLWYLECSKCARKYDHNNLVGTCECGFPLLARYDIEKTKELSYKELLRKRDNTLWRYHEFLPVINEKNQNIKL